MKTKRIHGPLQDLYDLLERTRSNDEQTQKRIDALAAEVRQALDQPGELRPEQQQDILQSMRTSVVHFEGLHPELTSVLNNVITTLANMGI